jgi:glycosyltransferase involved in cell wall biosynthesis
MKYRLHVLGIPHAVTHRDYATCAFTQKIVKFAKMMRALGHTVIHYGHEDSVLDCDEHVTVTTNADMRVSYGDHDWRKSGHPVFSTEDHIYKVFCASTIAELYRRKQPGDFLLCPFGTAHQPIAEQHPDMIAVESGIGYPNTFAKFRVFESYALMHALYGQTRVASMFNDAWYDAVIPNYFDLDDFTYSGNKTDDYLFLGRIGPGKGSHIASSIVKEIGGRLIVAGMGQMEPEPHIVQVGVVGPEERRRLLASAKAVFCISTYVEPFCGVQIEAMLSGTPVISTDHGAFAEYNLHGVTGYRCRTFEQFTWAARNIGGICPLDCRYWAMRNFSLARVGPMYEEYFWGLMQSHINPDGWYAKNPERQELDWLKRYGPGETG